jgi:hypothetical protein
MTAIPLANRCDSPPAQIAVSGPAKTQPLIDSVTLLE